jgi:hypothetical protein
MIKNLLILILSVDTNITNNKVLAIFERFEHTDKNFNIFSPDHY